MREDICKKPPDCCSPFQLCVVVSGGDGVIRSKRFIPYSVVSTSHISTFIRMRTEEISLGLHQVGRQPAPAVGIKVGQGGGDAGAANTCTYSQLHNLPPSCLPICQVLGKLRVHQQVGQVGVAKVGLFDAVQEAGTDDATTLPDTAQTCQIDIPALIHTLGLDDVVALGITADLRSVESILDVGDQLGLINRASGYIRNHTSHSVGFSHARNTTLIPHLHVMQFIFDRSSKYLPGDATPKLLYMASAARRSSLSPDRKRASRAEAMVGAAIECSAACWMVHLPVPCVKKQQQKVLKKQAEKVATPSIR